jgi:thioredoxin-related protein
MQISDLLQKFKNIKFSRNNVLIGIAVVGIIVAGGLIFASSNPNFALPSIFGLSDKAIGQKAIDYINNNGLSQTPASLVSVSEASGLVKVRIKIGTNEFDSYVTKDGKLLFAQAFEMTPAKTTASANTNTKTAASAADVKKSDSPMFEAFVVARCPYGLQMQRAMAEAVKNQPSLAQYMKVLYIGSVSGNKLVSMHGDAEATENLRQICIREEQPAKYWNYVSCQMKSGDTAGCEASTGVDSAKLNTCTTTASKGIAYAQKDFDLATKFNVSGSPTLVLNDGTVDESGFGGRSADGVKSMICAGFNKAAGFCSTKLNTAEAATSFSATYASSATAGSANSGSAGTNCAPAQ